MRRDVARFGKDFDGAAMRHGVAGVDHQIEQRRLQLRGIDIGARQILAQMPLHAAIAAHRFFDQHVEDRDRFVDVGGNRLQQLFAGKGQKLGDQPAAFVDGDLVDFQYARDARIAGIFGDELMAGLDDGEQIVEIMRDAAGELADHLLLLGLVTILPQRFKLALLRDVPDDFHESGGGTVSVMHRLDRGVGPEPLTGFANPPALLFIFSGMAGPGQAALRQQGGDIFRRIEAGEMLADDLSPGIALQFFGADIPGLYIAFEIEAENGVIVNAVQNDLQRGGGTWG